MAKEITNLKGIENGRAEAAFKAAELRVSLGKDYKNYVKKIPAMVKTNGLGATFGFMLSKKNKNEGKIYMKIGEDIHNWLKISPIGKTYTENADSFEKLIPLILDLNSQLYRALTIEVLAYLTWLKRFADGLIKGDDDE